jgi:hypothetical protein
MQEWEAYMWLRTAAEAAINDVPPPAAPPTTTPATDGEIDPDVEMR